MKLTDHLKVRFQDWVAVENLQTGTMLVEFSKVLEAFQSHVGLPVTQNMFGRLMTSTFIKHVNDHDYKTYYLLNKEL